MVLKKSVNNLVDRRSLHVYSQLTDEEMTSTKGGVFDMQISLKPICQGLIIGIANDRHRLTRYFVRIDYFAQKQLVLHQPGKIQTIFPHRELVALSLSEIYFVF